MDIVGVEGGHKTPRHSPIKNGEKHVVGNGDTRKREGTCRDDQLVQLAPPGNPLVYLGLGLSGVVASRARMRPLALTS